MKTTLKRFCQMEICFFHSFFFYYRDVLFKCPVFTVLQITNEGHFTSSKKIQNDLLQYYSPYKVLIQSRYNFSLKWVWFGLIIYQSVNYHSYLQYIYNVNKNLFFRLGLLFTKLDEIFYFVMVTSFFQVKSLKSSE